MPETSEMLAHQEENNCLGFVQKVEIGAEFVVYARRLDPSVSDYFPLPCQTEIASKAADQIRMLGRGSRPQKSK